jgi:hypothetical protein
MLCMHAYLAFSIYVCFHDTATPSEEFDFDARHLPGSGDAKRVRHLKTLLAEKDGLIQALQREKLSQATTHQEKVYRMPTRRGA